MIPAFYATVDRHQLHIADDRSQYGGKINSYNNFLTRFFARLFGQAVNVEFTGKTRTLNKKSYESFLNNNGIEANKENIKDFTDFNLTMHNRIGNWNNNGYIRYAISREKSTKLFKKMVLALNYGNLEKAKALACKGANLENTFWDAKEKGICFAPPLYLAPKRPMKIIATRYTPILFAAKNGFIPFARFLKNIGADTQINTETVKFKRKIAHVENQYHIRHRVTPVYDHHYHAPQRPHRHQPNYVYTPYVQKETVVHYTDKRKTMSTHFLDDNFQFHTVPAK